MRRAALLAAAAVIGLSVMAAGPARAAEVTGAPGAAHAATTPIEHFVYLMQEGHTFDEYFGTYPGADGIPAAACLPRSLADPSQGCLEPTLRGDRPPIEIKHNVGLTAAQIDGGLMDGFASALRDQVGAPESALAHYDGSTLGWYWNVADRYVLFDRFFSSSTGGHVANHMYWMTGARGPASEADAIPASGWGDGTTTVFDQLQAAGVPWKVYIEGYTSALAADGGVSDAVKARVPLLAMPRFQQDPALASHIVDLSEYYSDLQSDALPSVAFIAPSGATSERAPGDVTSGQTMVRSLVNELMRSSAWSSSAFLLSYDTSGGSYDHATPPAGSEPYGPRVPALLVSPYARAGAVVDTPLDASSALSFIREQLGLDADRPARPWCHVDRGGSRPEQSAPTARDGAARLCPTDEAQGVHRGPVPVVWAWPF